MKRYLVAVVLLPLLLAGCGDGGTPASAPSVGQSSTAAPTPTPTPTPSPSRTPLADLTDELIAKLPAEVRWVDEGTTVEYADGSSALLEDTIDAGLVLAVDTPDGEHLVGPVPDFDLDGGLAPDVMELDSGDVGYLAVQGGGEYAHVALLVPWNDQLAIAGNACFDADTNEYTRCQLS